MKYDSSMKQFHGDIVGALRSMLHSDIDKIAELSAEGSPTPLREYLKDNHGKCFHGGNKFDCTPNAFYVFFLDEDIILNNSGDKKLQLSWSQVATFIRNNAAEIFDNHEESPKTYLDILKEHYPNVDCDALYDDYCPGDFFNVALDSECDNCTALCDRCWHSTADSEWHENGEYDVPEEWKADVEQEQPTEQQDKPSEPPAADFPTCSCPLWRSEAFKYIGDRKKSILFSCDAYHSEDVTEDNTIDDIEHRCNNYLDCKHFLLHELEPVLKAESIKVNVNTPLDRLKQLYETHCQQTVPVPAEHNAAKTTTFDYSELDSGIAQSLRNCEAAIRQETAGYFTILGAKFKEAQDLLANHSSGTFERWYTSMGFKRQTVYNLIQRYEFSSSPTIGGREETFDNLPLTLSYDISKPDAPPELVEQVMSGDITTHKDFIKLKKDLEEAEEKKEFWINANNETNKENQQLRTDRNIALSRADNAERKLSEAEAKIKELDEYRERNAELEARDDEIQRINDALVLKNQKLEQRIKDIESRPVDVAVQSDEDALAEKDQEISELKEEIARMSDKNIKSFVIRMSLDDYEEFLNALESNGHSHLKTIMQNAKMIKL